MDKFEFAQRFQADKAKYYRIAYSYVKNEHDALDVMGEASYKALRSLKALKTPEYFSSWMTRIVINCALDALGERDRACVILHFFEGYTYENVSRILGEPESTVKSRVYRSLGKMRTFLQKGEH